MSRIAFLILIPILIGIVALISSFFIKWWALSFLIILLLFFYNGIVKIQADPPHKGIILFLGKRQEEILNEGWRFIPLSPIIFDFIPIKVVKINQDLLPQIIRTPDKAALSIQISATWTPCYNPPLLINFLNSGGEEGVKNILEDIIQDRIRSWALSSYEGPSYMDGGYGRQGRRCSDNNKGCFRG